MSETKEKQNPWGEGYKAGREAERSEMIKLGFQNRIRSYLREAVAEYRAYIITLNKDNEFVDTDELIALGRITEGEQIFYELRKKEQERKATKLNEVQDKNNTQTKGG